MFVQRGGKPFGQFFVDVFGAGVGYDGAFDHADGAHREADSALGGEGVEEAAGVFFVGVLHALEREGFDDVVRAQARGTEREGAEPDCAERDAGPFYGIAESRIAEDSGGEYRRAEQFKAPRRRAVARVAFCFVACVHVRYISCPEFFSIAASDDSFEQRRCSVIASAAPCQSRARQASAMRACSAIVSRMRLSMSRPLSTRRRTLWTCILS